MNKIITPIIGIITVIVLSVLLFVRISQSTKGQVINPLTDETNLQQENIESDGALLHPLSIETLRESTVWRSGSDITIEETLSPVSNYKRYIASYLSEGLKIYALLTVPNGVKPESGWPVIIFNHGYIPPAQYRTTERYVAYTDGFSANGYIVFRPDYRGHGNSEGKPTGAYGSNGYTIDVLNAVTSIKKLKDPSSVNGQMSIVDANRIGMWGHSMGGHITLRNMVVSRDIKAGVIWAGVVASYPDLINRWRRGSGTVSPSPVQGITVFPGSRRWRQVLTEQYGTPENNPEFWNSISANSYLTDISGPLQLHHGTADHSVPVEFSQTLKNQMEAAGQRVELFTYEGDDHNLTNNFSTAMRRSVEFFDKYVKGGDNIEK